MPSPNHLVWVLEDPLDGVTDPAIAIAERLGVPFRRIPLAWNWLAPLATFGRRGSLLGLAATGPGREAASAASPAARRLEPRRSFASATGPALILSAGRRAASVALWLKARFSSPLVQCMHPGPRGADIDMLVMPSHLAQNRTRRTTPVLGVPHRLSPLVLHQARQAWRERLSHMPRPRVALLVDGAARRGPAGLVAGGEAEMRPASAHAIGQLVAGLVRQGGGSVLANTTARTGPEATDALSAGLSSVMHVLHRWGEPGEDPYHGMVATADAVVVAGGSAETLSEACASEGPVFVALPDMAALRQRSLYESFFEADQARPIGEDLSPWARSPLDEAGRIARLIRTRFPLD